jgi:DNA-binding transcriptional LysR family regulator
MLDLNQVRMFVQVVRARSFAEAARRSKIPANTLSRHIRHLEMSLDTRLMQRSTRRLTLTEAGKAFYARCAAAVDDVLEAGKRVVEAQAEPSGTVRVAGPVDFLDLFHMEWVHQFLQMYSKVRLEFVLNDARADLIAESIDVAFRAGPVEESRLVYRRMGAPHFKLVASPAYLKRRGVPQSLRALEAHDCITMGGAGASSWTLTGPQGRQEVKIAARFSVNATRVLLNACVTGMGIALLPNILITQQLSDGRLVPVMPDYRREGVDFSVVLPSREQVPAAVVAFIEFAAAKMQELMQPLQPIPRRRSR